MTATKQPEPLPTLSQDAKAGAHHRTPAGAKRDRAMFQQHSDFVTHWHRVLRGGNALTVWHYLWDIAHRDGRWMFVGVDCIADRTGVHERTVKRCVKQLEAFGLLAVQRPRKPGRGNACGYRIPATLPLPEERVACPPPFARGKGGV